VGTLYVVLSRTTSAGGEWLLLMGAGTIGWKSVQALVGIEGT
jgi:hypothetical protein